MTATPIDIAAITAAKINRVAKKVSMPGLSLTLLSLLSLLCSLCSLYSLFSALTLLWFRRCAGFGSSLAREAARAERTHSRV